MVVKTERITILASADFKEFLTAEAEQERISVSELVQRRCKQPAANEDDEVVFAELVETLQQSVAEAEASLNQGIKDAEATLRELQSKAAAPQANDTTLEG